MTNYFILRPVASLLRGNTKVWSVLALMLLGLLLRGWFIAVNELQPISSPADDGDYYQRALRFATTGVYIDDFWLIRPPLHVMLFALMIRLSIILGNIDSLLLIRALQTSMLVLTIPMGYDIARRLFHWRAGLVFAFILAVWFPLVELPVHLFSEPTFFFFLILHLWLLLRWRDRRSWYLLAASGGALGFASLARSPTLYGGAFVLIWLILEQSTAENQERRTLIRRSLLSVLIFSLSCAAVVLPWTIRNYIVYHHLILVDTIGPVNLWLHVEKYDEKGVEILKAMPQAERQAFAVSDTRRIFLEDPVDFVRLLFRNAAFHFQHVWKAQFVEDIFVKRSFYGRPLRAMWMLGALGDLLWFVFTLTGLVALAAPLRDGAFRVLALLWLVYTVFAMMIMHIEPRYLLPVWLFLALYGAWLLGSPGALFALLRQQRLNGVLAAFLGVAFLWLCFSYRNYPETIARGIAREIHDAAGMQAFAAGDYTTAMRELRAAVELQPTFVETRANLALVYVAQGKYEAARQVLSNTDAQRMSVARGALARAEGDTTQEAAYFTNAETRSGEDAQHFALHWLPSPPTNYLELGNGRDLGYLAGFSPGEQATNPAAPVQYYRWLQGKGQIVLPLPEPLHTGSIVTLRLTSGQPNSTQLTVGFNDGTHSLAKTIDVASGEWRIYRLSVPDELAGERRLSLTLYAPVFIPAHLYPNNVDVRPLSLMVSAVGVE